MRRAAAKQVLVCPMRSIAFLTRKGGAGKTTLTASLAVAAAATGEKVIAFDLDSQGSLVRWSERRKTANVRDTVVIEPLESERLPQLSAILDGLAGAGFTVALFDTADAAVGGAHLVTDFVDLCLLPSFRLGPWRHGGLEGQTAYDTQRIGATVSSICSQSSVTCKTPPAPEWQMMAER
jgi:hypothetical protein